MDYFLSCDWGTSSFRLRLIQVKNLKTISEIKNDLGMLETFNRWQLAENPADRAQFYTSIIEDQLKIMSRQLSMSLQGIPVVLSGMASSTIGLMELPYKILPFAIDGSDLKFESLTSGKNATSFLIVSGARTENDVMRGEETKIVGCAPLLAGDEREQLLILPGTHPKHIFIKNGRVIRFKTFMTGEFFDLLSTKSILASSIEAGGDLGDPLNRESFIQAVKASRTAGLLHNSFMVRTNELLKHISKQQNFFYLSGLLIGTELTDITPPSSVYLLGGSMHTALYTLACEVLGIDITKSLDADQALINGQRLLLSEFGKRR
ncbi:2-dehydro-3-deoxygalactonokinase [Olivibacter sp. XZL3]|uniref:2-dehydro-3-deoxygalactonokinase n=1 Tax=Olivibacter sp. XZL3 TaxID=1735116 RepID=UPI0010652A34|nr:2-dehydro-3-deoxygalactonokinase [Olivibacter sp. XZL3]